MDRSGTEVGDIVNVDSNLTALTDELEKVGLIVENTEAGSGVHGGDPWLQLGRLRMSVEVAKAQDIASKNTPEAFDKQSAHSSAMKKTTSLRVSVDFTPDARAEPCEEASICEDAAVSMSRRWVVHYGILTGKRLDPFLERGHIRRRHP
jgi:hypothetical protein